jgi:xylulokinase
MTSSLALGIDFGTSGARAIAIDQKGKIQAQSIVQFEATTTQSPTLWQSAMETLLADLPVVLRQSLGAIAINGTSSTVLLCDGEGNPLTMPLMYNDDRGKVVLERLRAYAPANHLALSATSSLAKLLWWLWADQIRLPADLPYLVHQADWLGFLLHGELGISDYHNALKLGYDIGRLVYPDWLLVLDLPVRLPHVVAPGFRVANVTPAITQQFQIPAQCRVCAGTTDSIAAFLASGASHPGEAVTSLGSTLVIKLLSSVRLDADPYGIYSHRLGNLWLVGGASNTGGAVLRHFFSNEDLQTLSACIDPTQASPLDYYPLLKPGERFPLNDPGLAPRLTPQPDDPVEFLHGLLESMARIEAEGYHLLRDLGASPLTQVYTAGGGAQNDAWTAIRQRHLQVPTQPAQQPEAAYGTARLAMGGICQF